MTPSHLTPAINRAIPGTPMSFLFTVAEKPKGWDEAHPMVRGTMEMQRFGTPIHLGVVAAANLAEAYEIVLEDLRPTFADHPAPLEVRLEPIDPPMSSPSGIWRRHRPIDMDITWTADD